MRKALPGPALFILTSFILLVPSTGYGREPKMGLRLLGGYSLAQAKGTSAYSDLWNGEVVSNIHEEAKINYQAQNGIALGGAFSFRLNRNIGLEFGGAYFNTKVPNDTAAKWNYSFGGTDYSDEYAFSGEGKLSTVPLFLNVAGRFSAGLIDLNISAGPTLYFNRAGATATGIYGDNRWIDTWILWVKITYEEVDILPLAMEVPMASWTGFGFNAGGSLDLNLSPNLALCLEARYFYCPKKDLHWEYIPGVYDGLREILADWEIFPDQADGAEELTTPLAIDPSFFFFSLGLKFRFGPRA